MEKDDLSKYTLIEKQHLTKKYTPLSFQNQKIVPMIVCFFAYALGSCSFLLHFHWLFGLLIVLPLYIVGTAALYLYLISRIDENKHQQAYLALVLANVLISLFLLEVGCLIIFVTTPFFQVAHYAVIASYIIYGGYTLCLLVYIRKQKKDYLPRLLAENNDKKSYTRPLAGGLGFGLIGYLIGQILVGFGLEQLAAVGCIVFGFLMVHLYIAHICVSYCYYPEIEKLRNELDKM